MAAEMICTPSLLETFHSRALFGTPSSEQPVPDSEASPGPMRQSSDTEEAFSATAGGRREKHGEARHPIDPRAWAEGMAPALENPRFRDFLADCAKAARSQFWSGDPNAALQFDGNRLPHGTPIGDACARAHRRLLGDPNEPRWCALALFCLARMIAVNSKEQFNSLEWTDYTVFMFRLEAAFLGAKGKEFAHSLLRGNKTYFDGQLHALIGENMLHGLAEASINTRHTRFFA